MNTKNLFITVGISGCGKSTWLCNKYPVVETDDIRISLYNDINDEINDKLTFETAFNMILDLFKTNDTVYFGATMVETKHRVNFISRIKKLINNININIILFKCDIDISHKRVTYDIDNGKLRANSINLISTQYLHYIETLNVIYNEDNYNIINIDNII